MTPENLGHRYREAWLVARQVPGNHSLGYSNYWPEIKPNRWEVYCAEGRQPKPIPPKADAVERMVECMRWLRWLDESERELIWLRASGMPWRLIAKTLKVPRTTVQRHWHRALLQLTLRLKR